MNIKEIKLLLRKYGIKPRHRLGQNFLASEEVIQRQVGYAGLSGRDIVLEIGAGIGTLTEFLIDRAKKVYVVEKDAAMLRILKDRFGDAIEIISGDALEVELPKFDKTVSNIPYAISSPLTFRLLKQGFKKAILTYQKEFADRLVAVPGTRDYSRLSVATYYYANAEILEVLPPEVFYPKPKVNSAIVELKPKKPPFKVEENFFFKVVRGLFSHKNKTVRKALLHSLQVEKNRRHSIIEKALDKDMLERRVFKLLPEEIAHIANSLKGERL